MNTKFLVFLSLLILVTSFVHADEYTDNALSSIVYTQETLDAAKDSFNQSSFANIAVLFGTSTFEVNDIGANSYYTIKTSNSQIQSITPGKPPSANFYFSISAKSKVNLYNNFTNPDDLKKVVKSEFSSGGINGSTNGGFSEGIALFLFTLIIGSF